MEALGGGVADAFGVELFFGGHGFHVGYSGYSGLLVDDGFPTEELAGAEGLMLDLTGSGCSLNFGGTTADDDFAGPGFSLGFGEKTADEDLTGSGSGVFGPSPLQLTQ
tara:strand:- start:13857 stop:14180 length:324 start_codon:yes stop_codon:yes gene_type:complete